MAHDQFAFGPYAAAFFQRVAFAAHGVAFDALGRTGLIALCGRHQTHVVDHHRVAVDAHRLGHAGGGFQLGGHGVGHRRERGAHRRFADVRDEADHGPLVLFTGDDVVGLSVHPASTVVALRVEHGGN